MVGRDTVAVSGGADVVLVDEGHSAIAAPDAAEPAAPFVDPGVQLAGARCPGVNCDRWVDAANIRRVARAVDGVLELQVRGERIGLDLGPVPAQRTYSGRVVFLCSDCGRVQIPCDL